MSSNSRRTQGQHTPAFATLSHELKNPLNLVMLNAAMLEHYAAALPEAQAQGLKEIAAGLNRASERMHKAISDFQGQDSCDAERPLS